jgi:hypothetical protein
MKGPRYLLQNEKLTYPHTGRVTAPQISMEFFRLVFACDLKQRLWKCAFSKGMERT